MKKLISASSFQLKGTGWYKTDYASPKEAKASEEAKPSQEGKKGKSSETKPSDSKESKSEQKTGTNS